MVTQYSEANHVEEIDALHIKLQLNILAPIPIQNQSKEFRECSTSLVEIISTQNKVNIKNATNKINIINRK